MPQDRKQIGAYSKLLHRGSLGRSVDGRSAEGRFLRALEAELIRHVGGAPSIAQRLLIARVARASLQLELLYEKMAAGEPMTDHDGRIVSALNNAVRLGLRELGLQPAPPKPPTLAEYLAAKQGTAA